MVGNNWELLGKLRRAIKKIQFIVDFNKHKWRLMAMIIGKSSKRRLSFNDRPGLRAFTDINNNNYYYFDLREGSGSSGRTLHRSSSCPLEDDIDRRADTFIANFYKQLQLERQISLELKDSRGNSFDSMSP